MSTELVALNTNLLLSEYISFIFSFIFFLSLFSTSSLSVPAMSLFRWSGVEFLLFWTAMEPAPTIPDNIPITTSHLSSSGLTFCFLRYAGLIGVVVSFYFYFGEFLLPT